jgi:hypothetical protein
MPTMLIDEAGSTRNNRTLRHMLRAGTMRDVVSVQANRSYDANILDFWWNVHTSVTLQERNARQ